MSATTLATLMSANETLFHLLEETRCALAGRREFNVELVRALSALISDTDPILRLGPQIRGEHLDFVVPLDHYLRLAVELHTELDKAQVMLTTRRDSLKSARSHLHAVGQFTAALSCTR